MITQDTAARLWNCHRDIAAGEKLLVDMAKAASEYSPDGRTGTLKDAFGRCRNLQLGIPSGENGHRLLDVSPTLAESVIRAHIAIKQAELVEINEQARMELEAATNA